MDKQYETRYAPVYTNDRQRIVEYVGNYVAAIKEIYDGDRLVSRDEAVEDTWWIDESLPDSWERAINARETL